MDDRNTWVWVTAVIVVLVLIGAFFWWSNPSSTTAGDMASTTAETATTTSQSSTGAFATEPAPVKLVNKTDASIGEILASLTGDSTYTSLYSSTGVGATLGSKGPYTVFVSTDAGYALLKPGTITNMTAAQKKRLVQYSIVSGRALDVNAQDSGSVKALSGDLLNFTVGPTNMVQVNSSFALGAYKAKNGIVYILNQPLVPPTSGNIMTP